MRARDDFLTGITTFVETHCTDEIEIHRLRHKLLLRCRNHDGDARCDIECGPQRFGCAACGGSQRGFNSVALGHRRRDEITVHRQLKHCDAIRVHGFMHCGWRRRGKRLDYRYGCRIATVHAKQNLLAGNVTGFNLGPQNVHRQPFAQRLAQRARQHHVIRAIVLPEQHTRQQSAFGRAVTGVLAALSGNRYYVVGELALQERLRVRAVESQHARLRDFAPTKLCRHGRLHTSKVAEGALYMSRPSCRVLCNKLH